MELDWDGPEVGIVDWIVAVRVYPGPEWIEKRDDAIEPALKMC